MTDTSLRIDDPKAVIDAILKLISGDAVAWWTTNSSEIKSDINTLANAAAQTTKALLNGGISREEADRFYAGQRRVLEATPVFVEFMAAAGAQSLLDGIFGILGTAIKNVVGINPFTIFKV